LFWFLNCFWPFCKGCYYFQFHIQSKHCFLILLIFLVLLLNWFSFQLYLSIK
jgi:hypothetical protein